MFFCFACAMMKQSQVEYTVYHSRNATGKNGYCAFDITDDTEEPDPLNRYFGDKANQTSDIPPTNSFCPYCGARVQNDFAFCRKRGKQLPKE